ncbi:MAG: hypothetical protein A2Y82_03470 [Candidatus Buchananbacteria bacterium RBG_13_36_9]|uniref:Uncharacterized protein n=1 Tax=Candidatus Buchananbacteria bacterium RBG_13_36_9 TaxID=1797530 RepID=A0A1G1XLE2_9BACT|nr:MAG: hypothetical protein A2Y82_03470 [Candidatus Buchananbacteria bacterium RBG_13_36_9]
MKKLVMSARGGSAFGGKKIFLFSILLLTLIFISGCNLISNNLNQNQYVASRENQKIIFYTSPDPYTKYCNGADMDSAGYKNSLTKSNTISIAGKLSRTDIIKMSVRQASKNANLETITNSEPDFLKIIGDTTYLKPIDGWAGVSIFLCAWKPLVEVNLLHFPEIKKVEWINDLQKWGELK